MSNPGIKVSSKNPTNQFKLIVHGRRSLMHVPNKRVGTSPNKTELYLYSLLH